MNAQEDLLSFFNEAVSIAAKEKYWFTLSYDALLVEFNAHMNGFTGTAKNPAIAVQRLLEFVARDHAKREEIRSQMRKKKDE